MFAWYVYIPALYTIPLNGEVYGVVYSIYIFGAGSTLLVTPMGYSYDLDRWQVTVDSRVFLLYGKEIDNIVRIWESAGYNVVCHVRTNKFFV